MSCHEPIIQATPMSETANYLEWATSPFKSTRAAHCNGSRWRTPGDRAIQVGFPFHFVEVNRALRFDRAASFGMRINIPAGTAVRFSPATRSLLSWWSSVAHARSDGLNGLTNGSTVDPDRPVRVRWRWLGSAASGDAPAEGGAVDGVHQSTALRRAVRAHHRRPGFAWLTRS